jgi:hypothetical protein
MKLSIRHVLFAGAMALGLTLTISTSAWPGGNDDSVPQDHHDDGPFYFGFVKDANGKMVPDAKVTAEIKGRGTVITRSNATGFYKIPGFGKEVTPNNVNISCNKDGYRQTRVVRRTPVGKNPVSAIETECTLQRVVAK